MKVVAYCPLLYGADYLGYAIRSVIDAVDEFHCIFDATEHGSHGSQTDRTCPDKREDLIAIAWEAAKGKLHWTSGYYPHEGIQRMTIHELAPDADVILALDADEIWPEALVKWATNRDYPCGGYMAHDIRVPMVHAWRSLYRAVLHDPAFPTRIILPRWHGSAMTTVTASDQPPIFHAGYAQRSEVVEFKQFTHGHRGEWRKDCDWFQDRFMANAQVDCHPVGSEYWNPEPIDPWDYLPAWMKDHPYAKLDLIP